MSRRNPDSWRAYDVGDLVVLLDQSGVYKPGGGTGSSAVLWDVSGYEAMPTWGAKGAIALTTADSPGAPAPFVLDSQGKAGVTIAPGGNTPRITPLAYQLQEYQLGQIRFRPQYFDLDAGLVADDLSVLGFSGAIPRWTMLNSIGELVSMQGVPDPVDFAVAAASGVAQASPVNFPSEDIWKAAEASELWTYYTKLNPGFQLVNRNTAVTMGTNGTATWLMRSAGWVYSLTPYSPAESTHIVRKAGSDISVPVSVGRGDFDCVQLQARTPNQGPV